MKKIYYHAMAFLLLLTVSCVSEKIESDEDRTSYNKEAVWEYNGDNTTLNKVIEELKSGPEREKLERRLLKNDVLWEEAKFLLIDNKRRILVPFLSTDRENVIGILSLVKDIYGKTTFDMTVRSQLMLKNNKLPFWDNGIWLGYFMALDKDILGIKNGNPGIGTHPAKDNLRKANAKIMGQDCKTIEEEIIFYQYYYVLNSTGEIVESGYQVTHTEYVFKTVCYWVPDPPTPITDPNPGNDGGNDGSGGGYVSNLQIFNYLTGKPLCIYNMMMNSNTGFNNLIKKFDGKFPVSHLQLQNSATLPNNINAQTYPPNNYNIRIEININNLSRPNLSIARTIIHEIIHAEMYRKILSILKNGGDLNGLTEAQWEEKLSNSDYPGIFDYYSRFGEAGMDHELMAAHYRTVISDFLKELQPGLSQQIYDSLAWEGLKNTTAWNNLSQNQKNIINNTISNFNNIGGENCTN